MDEVFAKVFPRMEVVITKEDVDDIMCAALEGGINYWCNKVEVIGEYLGEYASEQISRGGKLIIYDCEEDEKYVFGTIQIIDGIRLYIEKRNRDIIDRSAKTENCELKIDTCIIDASVADEIIQLGLFGEVMYG